MLGERRRGPLGEFLPLERLEERARALGAAWTVAPRGGGRHVLSRLDENLPVLRRAYRVLASDVRAGEAVTPAVAWLLDNFHLLEAEVRGARHDLPRAYNRKLPRLVGAEHGGAARIEALAWDIVAQSDARLDAIWLERFLAAFQTVTPLTLAELWAWPSFLRAALVDHLRVLSDDLLEIRAERLRADALLARDPSARPLLPDPPPPAFATRVLQRAREYGASAGGLVAALADRLGATGQTLEDAVRAENQRQAALQVSIANAVSALRLCETLDWGQFVERVSLVDEALRYDPGGVYGRMDFSTRDRYRHAIEKLAPRSGEDQVRVARRAAARAREAPPEAGPRVAHVGWFLVGPGRPEFEKDVGQRRGPIARIRRSFFRHAAPLYLGCIFVLTAAGLVAVSAYARAAGVAPGVEMWAFALAALPISEIAVFLVQRFVDALIPPRRLPRLDFSTGVPESARTLVVFPTLFEGVAAVEPMLRHLEVQALANPDLHVHFALLSDFADAVDATRPDDDAILAAASRGIAALNAAHGTERFFLFHRVRRWNASEGLWMGWERKRGKLEELNRLLRGATDTSFGLQVGDLSILPSVRYVLTLDSDTRLPRDTARTLVGILEHPLNRPRLDPAIRRVTEGYGILQPRVSIATTSAASSRFARVFSGHTGVDPYTTAVSDTYQDLFGEGVFAGKGLYDVDAFQTALEGRVPENSLLSHDLFEGLYARTALVTDVEVVDDYPSNVLAHARRQHRWVRGDWQILRWLLPLVPTRLGLERNRLPLIAQWKILDNLRRSPPAAGAPRALRRGPHPLARQSSRVGASRLLGAGASARRRPAFPRGWSLPQQPSLSFVRELFGDLETAAAQTLVGFAFLPHYAFESVHAISSGRSCASSSRGGGSSNGRPSRRLRRVPPAFSPPEGRARLRRDGLEPARGGAARAPCSRHEAIRSPLGCSSARLVGSQSHSRVVAQPRGAVRGARRSRRATGTSSSSTARKTWRYFEELVQEDANGLAPDRTAVSRDGGFPLIAPRTSPTNIGLALLADLAAHDFGWLETDALLARLDRTLRTVEGLERWRGHLLNWYDTWTLELLHQPRYVSTVDSGDLAARLLMLAQGLREMRADGDLLRAQDLARRARSLADVMDFRPLYDASRGLSWHRMPPRRPRHREARRDVLRPSRLGGALRELPGHRQGRRASEPLVPGSADLPVTLHGISTYGRGEARRSSTSCRSSSRGRTRKLFSTRRAAWRSGARRSGGARTACRGELPNRHIASRTSWASTSTGPSASPASAFAGASTKTSSWRLTRPLSPRFSRPPRR